MKDKMKIEYKPFENKKIDRFFGRNDNAFVEVIPGNVILPKEFGEIGQSIVDFKVREDDVWMISFPRTGSTWAQELVWLLGNNLNYDGAKVIQQIRAPLLELSTIFFDDHKGWLDKSLGNSVTHVDKMPSPRYIKTHLPEQLLPISLDQVKPKIIYTARNPKDLCVSYYHYFLLVHDAKGASFEDFCDLMLDDQAPYGSVWQHMLAFWRRRNDPNVLFLKYEDMKRDLPTVIGKCVEFLELQPLTDAELSRICEHLKFKRMQTNSAVNLEAIMYNKNIDDGADAETVEGQSENKFIRKGEVGDWKNYMSDEMSARFDEWIEKRFKHSGLEFEYE